MDTQRTNLDLLLIRNPGLGFVLGFDLVVPIGGIESGGRGDSEEVVGGEGRGRSWPGSWPAVVAMDWRGGAGVWEGAAAARVCVCACVREGIRERERE